MPPPTFLPRTAEEAQKLAVQVISKKTSDEIDDEERALMDRALAENSVIVAQMTPFFD